MIFESCLDRGVKPSERRFDTGWLEKDFISSGVKYQACSDLSVFL